MNQFTKYILTESLIRTMPDFVAWLNDQRAITSDKILKVECGEVKHSGALPAETIQSLHNHTTYHAVLTEALAAVTDAKAYLKTRDREVSMVQYAQQLVSHVDVSNFVGHDHGLVMAFFDGFERYMERRGSNSHSHVLYLCDIMSSLSGEVAWATDIPEWSQYRCNRVENVFKRMINDAIHHSIPADIRNTRFAQQAKSSYGFMAPVALNSPLFTEKYLTEMVKALKKRQSYLSKGPNYEELLYLCHNAFTGKDTGALIYDGDSKALRFDTRTHAVHQFMVTHTEDSERTAKEEACFMVNQLRVRFMEMLKVRYLAFHSGNV